MGGPGLPAPLLITQALIAKTKKPEQDPGFSNQLNWFYSNGLGKAKIEVLADYLLFGCFPAL